MLRPNSKLNDVFNKYKDDDGFLYILYTGEDIFGWSKWPNLNEKFNMNVIVNEK